MASRQPKPQYDITCSLCGVKDKVPFKPRGEDTALCRKCHSNSQPHVPRKTHNTRVSFPITCSQCGAHEVLEYRPRVPLTQVMCSSCMKGQVSATSGWSKIKAERVREAAKTQVRVKCDECGVVLIFNERPPEGKEVYCASCLYGIEEVGRDALDGTQRLGPSVHIRSKKSKQ